MVQERGFVAGENVKMIELSGIWEASRWKIMTGNDYANI